MAKVDGNGNYVYPKVPRKYWKAVVMACKIIQEKQAFNVAIDKASKQFDVNPETLKNHVVARTQAGCEYARAKRAKAKRERVLSRAINPQLPRMLDMPQGHCKDCEFCRVNNEQISKFLLSLRNKAAEIEKGVAEIFSNETKPKHTRSAAAKRFAREQMGLKYVHSIVDRLSTTKPNEVSADDFFEALKGELVHEIVCTRHAQARMNRGLCELAFPVIPRYEVFNGSIGCGEFEDTRE